MVDLPRYVRGRPNPTGRMYFSYERHRGTPHAWPILPLPFSPQDDEFWRRCRQCERLQAEPRDESWHGRGCRRAGAPTRCQSLGAVAVRLRFGPPWTQPSSATG